jgi:energy-coupling factor transport system substrate-specific component
VIALFYLLGGNSALSTASIIGLGVLAEVILWVGRYRSRWAVIWAYTVFGLSFLTPLLPFVIDRKAYFASATWAEMGAEYISAADALLTGPVLLGTGLAIAVAGFLGGLLGSAILRKHFVRAGLA